MIGEGLNLIYDEVVLVSDDIGLVRLDKDWYIAINDMVLDEVWDIVFIVCKGFGVLYSNERNKFKFIWENGDTIDIGFNRKYTLSSYALILAREATKFIVRHEGLKGLSERAFYEENEDMEDLMKEEIEKYTDAFECKLIKNTFRSIRDCIFYRYRVCGVNYWGVMNIDETEWLVDIMQGYRDVNVTKDGMVIFNGNETHIVYKQKDVIKPFIGSLVLVKKGSNIYRFEPRLRGLLKQPDIRKPLIINNVSYVDDCLIKLGDGKVKVIAKKTKDFTGSMQVKYYSKDFIIWGQIVNDRDLKDLGSGESLEGYKLVGKDKRIILEPGKMYYTGYIINYDGEKYFDKMVTVLVENINTRSRDGIRDILAYRYNDKKKEWQGLIITPLLRKIVTMNIGAQIYREEIGGWLKIVWNNEQRFYYNGEIYKDMSSLYDYFEPIPVHSTVGQTIYVCRRHNGSWTATTADFEPIGIKHHNWYDTREEVIEEYKGLVNLGVKDYRRVQIGLMKEQCRKVIRKV